MTPIDADKLRSMWADEWTKGRIAKALGISISAVTDIARSLGLRRAQGWKPPGFTAWAKRRSHAPRREVEPVPVRDDDEQAAIAEFLARHGAIRCPTAAVAPTSAILPPEDVAALEQHEAARAAVILPGPRAAAARWRRRRAAEAMATQWRTAR